jgi:probable HAF family extracellular repeat protein
MLFVIMTVRERSWNAEFINLRKRLLLELGRGVPGMLSESRFKEWITVRTKNVIAAVLIMALTGPILLLAVAAPAPVEAQSRASLTDADSVSFEPRYSVTDLGGYIVPYAINNQEQVVGALWESTPSTLVVRAVLWENGTIHELYNEFSEATDINDAGQVVGYHSDFAFLWENGTVFELDPLYEDRAFAHGINDAGQVVGESAGNVVLWENSTSGIRSLDALGWARSINNFGQIVGERYMADGFAYAFLWEDQIMHDLGALGGQGSVAWDINDGGQVVGEARTESGTNHAFLWEDNVMSDLGTLGGDGSSARAVNSSGSVVGSSTFNESVQSHAFLWDDDTMYDLNDLIDPDSGWVLRYARDINDAGQIVGVGEFNGEPRGFLLTPAVWTVMFYLDGDNDLDHTYPGIFNNLEEAVHSDVNVVALWDRLNGPAYYYHVQADDDPNVLASYEEGETRWSQGEVDMGAPSTLSDFVTWAMTEFPGGHYALVLDDHGSGLGGGLVDDSAGYSIMSLPQMQQALATVHAETGEKIDVLYMAMCLMGMIEDAYQFRDFADYYVANEDLQWSFRSPYREYVAGIGKASTPRDVAQLFAKAYADVAVAAGDPNDHTISVVDLAHVAEVASAAYGLGNALQTHMGEVLTTLAAVLVDVQRFDNEEPRGITTEDTSIDLYHFADLISVALGDYPDILAAAEEVKRTVATAVIYERHGSTVSKNLNNSHGLAVFFPATSSSFYNPLNYDFAVGAGWGRGAMAALSNEGSWAAMVGAYVVMVNPDGHDNPTPPAPVSKQVPTSQEFSNLFLPLVHGR